MLLSMGLRCVHSKHFYIYKTYTYPHSTVQELLPSFFISKSKAKYLELFETPRILISAVVSTSKVLSAHPTDTATVLETRKSQSQSTLWTEALSRSSEIPLHSVTQNTSPSYLSPALAVVYTHHSASIYRVAHPTSECRRRLSSAQFSSSTDFLVLLISFLCN